MRIQWAERFGVIKEIRMTRRPTKVAIFKKHFEPITLECATSTLNTLSKKIFKSFLKGSLFGGLYQPRPLFSNPGN